MEQRDCFMADDESSTEEEAPAEATLDQEPAGNWQDQNDEEVKEVVLLDDLQLA